MTTYIWYSTFATAMITTIWGNVYQRDLECHELQWFKTWAKDALEDDGCEIPSRMIVKITFIDNNGELLLECSKDVDIEPQEEEDWDDWGYNEDEGYDPYEGCYTYDC